MPAVKEISSRRMNTVTLSIPQGSQTAFLRSLSRNMGWKMKVSRPEDEVRYPALDRAIEDVKAGRVTEYTSAEEMFKKLGI